ncbi:MAG: hypothetical protein LBL59_12330 [Xanthomonadaceae bacterium]|jgi:hypothetical protein|nr:hypothetical protein [Xanthomonadaceae bacterium]
MLYISVQSILFHCPEVIAAAIILPMMLKLKPRPGRSLAVTGAGIMLAAAVIGLVLGGAQMPLYFWLVNGMHTSWREHESYHTIYSMILFVFWLILFIGVVLTAWGCCRMVNASERSQPGQG